MYSEAFCAAPKVAFRNEYIESVFGSVAADSIYIHALYPLAHKATARTIDFSTEELDDAREVAQSCRLRFLGSLHTHPNCDPVPSPSDILPARDDGEIVIGICALYRKNGRTKAKVKFWPAVLLMELVVVA